MIMESGIITPIFAEASNAFMGQFVYAGLALIGGILAGLGIMAYIKRPEPTQLEQPIRTTTEGEVQVRNIDKYATRDFVTERHAEVNRRLDGHDKALADLRDDMKEDRKQNEIHASARSSKIYDEIKSVRSELSDKIDNMPERIIDTLNKLGLLNTPNKR